MKRISLLKRRAIVLLFLDGTGPTAIAKLFQLTKPDVETVLRNSLRRRR